MYLSDFPRATWRKSSHSDDGVEGDWVEIAELPDRVAMRDSKAPAGPVLAFANAEWSVAFESATSTDSA